MSVLPSGSPEQLRALCRSGVWSAPTSGMAPGFVQCNLVVIPERHAGDFLAFCQRNPRPCPLLAFSPSPGRVDLPELGATIDLRSDLPRYREWRDGVAVAEHADIGAFWQGDFVAFALGCSFSFEEALLSAGLEIRNVTEGVNVPMYRTNRPCQSAGPFSGNLVVSMRPFTAANAIRAIQICSRFPDVHGAPVHFGDPGQLGITNLAAPDFGSPVSIRSGEVPVFWACGVTPQVALEAAKLPVAFTHAPGHMLITDRRNAELASF